MKLSHRLFLGNLDDGERILYVAHRHLLMFKIAAAKVTFFGIILPILGYMFFPGFITIFIMWALIGAMGLVYHFLDWYFKLFN